MGRKKSFSKTVKTPDPIPVPVGNTESIHETLIIPKRIVPSEEDTKKIEKEKNENKEDSKKKAQKRKNRKIKSIKSKSRKKRDVRIHISMYDELRDGLDKLSKFYDVPRSELIVYALENFYDRNKNVMKELEEEE